MFDIGVFELALLALVGLLVLGPERLPRVARTIGLYIRKARNAWTNLKYSVEQELEAEDLKKAIQQVKEDTQAIGESLNQTIGSDSKQEQETPTSKHSDGTN